MDTTNRRWGQLRSHLHDLDYTSAWDGLAEWPDETRPDAIRYVIEWCEQNPELSRAQLVRYTPWFEQMLCDAMCLETRGHHDEALRHYRNLLSLKPDCLPAAIAAHRLKGRHEEILPYCCEQAWEKVEVHETDSGFASPRIREFWESFLSQEFIDFISTHDGTDLPDDFGAMCYELLGEMDSQCAREILPFIAEIAFREREQLRDSICVEFLWGWSGDMRYGYTPGIFPEPNAEPLLTDLFEYERMHRGALLRLTRAMPPELEEYGAQIMMPSLFLGAPETRRDDLYHPLVFCGRQVILGCLPVILALGENTDDERIRTRLWVLVLDCGAFGQRLYAQTGSSFGARADPSLY